MTVRAARAGIDSTRWNPSALSFLVMLVSVCCERYSLSERRTTTYLPDRKHLTCGIPVVMKKVVLMSEGGVQVKVYLRVRGGLREGLSKFEAVILDEA